MGSVAKNSLSLFIIKLPNPFLSIKIYFITKIRKMYTYICIVPNLIVDFLKNNK
ncbi:hypothetical protein I2800192A2_32840 [Anaerostipes hadrus]